MNKLNPFSGSNKTRSWFWWGIKIGAVMALAIWWWLENLPGEREKSRIIFRPRTQPGGTHDSEITIDDQKPEESEKTSSDPDDLKVIEGLGPKSAQVLTEAGILTFKALSKMSPEEIHEVLKAAGMRIATPRSWPEQAALAAAGEWEKLKDLQDSLVGGRKA
jgi:predicted flap endonuclease-1-like 5' DNA nuclease